MFVLILSFSCTFAGAQKHFLHACTHTHTQVLFLSTHRVRGGGGGCAHMSQDQNISARLVSVL